MVNLGARMRVTSKRMLTIYGDTLNCIQYSSTDNEEQLAETAYQILGTTNSYKPIEVNGTTILATDISLMCYSETVRPLVGDIVTLDGLAYRVQNVDINYLQGLDIYYILQLRK
jgi:hypothetical protein